MPTETITVTPTPTWVPLKIEGLVPAPYRTPKFNLRVVPLHPTFACELQGVDWSKDVSPELYQEIREIVDKYGVVVCRKTGLTDEAHIKFSANFGDLDDVKPYQKAGRTHRLAYPELFDAGNIDPNTGDVAPLTAAQVIGNKANELFHVDSSFNGRRAGHSLLLAHVLPPPGTGGSTEYADSRTAYDELPDATKKQIEGLVANHSLFHSRKTVMPDKLPLSKHKLSQTHEWSGRKNLYIASYVHSIEGLDDAASKALIAELLAHVQQPRYRVTIDWHQPGDMIMWDNTSVMHRATGGSYEGQHRRDMRRTTVKDMSRDKYGLNGDGADWRNKYKGPLANFTDENLVVFDPLYDLEFDSWFLSKGRNCHLAEPTGVWEIQANSQISVPWANWQNSTGFYADGKEENERPSPYSVTNPEVVAQGLVSESKGLKSPNMHAANKSTAAGTAIAVSYVNSIWDVSMENLVVVSIASETPFERLASYKIPDLAACESCICVTG
ncbi:hypothetical protein ACCO45_012179 [Purpureocillium lilacinum]|uniref:Uncharacterized protein n=1 Tax=Purpureocillium lilacinum TaxID=33203 RepID=A0ACC4DDP2_PURLI